MSTDPATWRWSDEPYTANFAHGLDDLREWLEEVR